MKYEHKIVCGDTIEGLAEIMNTCADIRNKEISEQLDKGFDVMDSQERYFAPVGELSFVNGEFYQVMRRVVE